ncbi:DsbA family oxidoreductase [Pseudomonas sp. B21-040]|uniref:DsbA family oxidoreductase n=1 Tax=Pseudomonas TaxID=286 RepID=UPI0005FB3378|nr:MULTISPECIES: DsbA family oxidoreductase [Pseudomonas]KJZ39516.1 DSBA oxidoreductase [Pseudomonas fluorescens]OOG11157.1 disulfide bond formation protein DsbA [Pseudomonas sp. C9]PWK35663.1 putative DsbA family dithiol-disulfide isomerase [Pseudomonas sp. OV226]UVL42680.1 DsbA family oxidoreductase [Pseudomonas sp. B21-040]
MSGRLRIDVFFDFICPWCLIGKRQLERAQELLRLQHPDVLITTVWHGVQLLPHLPVQGEPFAQFYLNRLGSAEAVAMRQAQVKQAANSVGVAIDLGRIATMPNTADAHRLLAHANTRGSRAQRDLLLERLFAAYFQNGEDLGCRETLIAIAQSCGYDADAVKNYLQDESGPFVGNEVGGSSGVPSFQFDRRITMVGAQPPEALLGAMIDALHESQRERSPS